MGGLYVAFYDSANILVSRITVYDVFNMIIDTEGKSIDEVSAVIVEEITRSLFKE